MNRAFSANWCYSSINPGRKPWAGMKDAVGVADRGETQDLSWPQWVMALPMYGFKTVVPVWSQLALAMGQ